MRLSHSIALRAACFILTCSALPAVLAANCAGVAGDHYGTFSAKKTRGGKELPETIEGTWKVKIDRKTCAVTGTVTSGFTGTAEVKGNYGPYRNGAKGSFDPSDIFFQEESKSSKYLTFAFGSDKPDTNYVNINNNDMAYWGSFKADK